MKLPGQHTNYQIMKKKIVLWGTDETDKKILLALELLAEENKVKLFSFPEEIATEEFYNQMMNEWREDLEVSFPKDHKTVDRPLSMTEDLLPEDIRVERTDLITRAKAEWHFVVLSGKLYDLYKSELEDLRERINGLSEYDSGIFEEMKVFWAKVSEQARDKNLFRGHADKLKELTNELFAKMKELRSKANEEFAKISKENRQRFDEQIEKINDKIDKGLGLKPIFDELKSMQAEFNKEKFTKSDRNSLWNKIDEAFKKVKLKRYGDKGVDPNNSSRLERRYKGLIAAIEKMEKSIARDMKDIEFQNKRADTTQGQLEMQIRQAKAKMVQERIDSKNLKLKDMLSTRSNLEKKLHAEQQKMAAEQQKQKVKEKAEELKEKVAEEISHKAELMKEEADKLDEAAKAINEGPENDQVGKESEQAEEKENVLENIKTEIGEMIEDVVDTVKAVSEVVEENLEEKGEQIKKKLKDKADELNLEEKLDTLKEKAEDIKEKVEDTIEEVMDTLSGAKAKKKKDEEE